MKYSFQFSFKHLQNISKFSRNFLFSFPSFLSSFFFSFFLFSFFLFSFSLFSFLLFSFFSFPFSFSLFSFSLLSFHFSFLFSFSISLPCFLFPGAIKSSPLSLGRSFLSLSLLSLGPPPPR